MAALALSITATASITRAQGMPASTQAFISNGMQLLRSGQALEARKSFDAAVKAMPRSADALTWRGISENQLEQYDAAAMDFERAIGLQPSLLAAHYNLALSYIRLHKIAASMDELKRVISLQPDAVPARYNLAILLESKGLFSAAAEHLRRAHALSAQDKEITLHLLLDDLKLNQAADVEPLVRDLADTSTGVAMQREAGAALLEAKRFPDVVTVLSVAHDRELTASDIDLLLARGLIGEHQDTAAIALLANPAAASKEEPERSYLLGLAYLDQGATIEAAASFANAVRLAPRDARPLYHLSLLSASMPGKREEAIEMLRSAITLEPANASYSLALARLLLVDDRAEEAKALLEKMSYTREDEAQRHALLGVALAATHETVEAVPQLRKAIDEDPSLALADNVLGFCLMQKGDYAKAAEAYGRASELEPNRALYARDAALGFARANRGGDAVHLAERATSLEGTNAGNHLLLGKLYAAGGRRPEALRELLRAAELDPDSDSACYLLARTYQQEGDRQQALAWSDKLRALKLKHQGLFDIQKKVAAEAIRSSRLLEGGLFPDEELDK